MSVFVGNVTTDTIRFEDIDVGFVTAHKVGISNLNPANTLDIGSNVSVSDTGSNTIAVKGNVSARYYYGDAGFMSNVQFRESNVTQTVLFSNADTSLTTYSNVGISNLSPVNALDVGSSLSIDTTTTNVLVVRGGIVADDGYFISNLNPNAVYTGEFSNATTAFVTLSKAGIANVAPQNTLDIGSNISISDEASNAVINVLGNVVATYYYGDGRYLSNVVVFAAANIVGNVMIDTIEFRDPEVAFVTYEKVGIANVNPQNTLDVGSNLSVDDLASNIVAVHGNVVANYFTGDGRYLTNVIMTANLESVSVLGSESTYTLGMLNPDLSFYSTGVRAGISNGSPIHTLDVGSNLYIDDTSDDVLVVNGNIISTGNIMVTGNITATYFAGDGTLIQNVTSNTSFTTAVNRANFTSNVLQFQNTAQSFVAYGPGSIANANPIHTLDVGSNVYIQDDAPNVFVVRGVIVASAFIGDGNGVSNVISTSDLEVTVNAGNVTSNTVQFANATTAFVTYSNVGIANLDPQHTLDVGSNLYVQDDAAVESILTVTGNVSAYYFKGDGRYLSNVPTCSICSTLNYVTNIGNTTANTVRFVENTVSLITESNVGIANEFPIHTMDIGSNIYLNDSTETTVFTTGNIISNYIIADGSKLYNLSVTLGKVVDNGNVTSNIARFTHPTECISLASNIKMDGDLYITSPRDSSIRLGHIDTDGPVHSHGLSNTNRIAIGTEAGQLGQYQQAVAIGMRAGNQGQGESSVAIGIQSGEHLQRNYAMALGFGAGNDSQNAHAIAIGYRAGLSFQNVFSTAIGSNAGSWYQESNAMAIGEDAGYSNQSFRATAIGSLAGRNDQGQSATAIGYRAGDRTQGSYSLAVGNFAGSNTQGANCIALGSEAGYDNQGTNAFALGLRAGYWFQGEDAIALGVYAGLSNQDTYAIAIGSRAGQFNQNVNTLAIGTEAGRTSQNVSAFAVGHYAGWNSQGINAHALGHYAGYTSQGTESLAVGLNAGYSKQGAFAFAFGTESGYDNQGANAVAIGMRAGYTSQGTSSVAIGHQAGMTSQSMNAVAIGIQSGMTNQGETAVAIGIQSGMTSQGANAFALGEQAGMTSQGIDAYAIGFQAGVNSQGMAAYAIGKQSGFNSQGANAIAIGFQSGMNNQGIYSLAFGSEAGSNAQGSNSIGIGHQSSFDRQGDYSIAVGFQSGYTQQLHKSISIGYNSGLTSQKSNALAIGTESGYSLQGDYSIAVGFQSGYSNQMGGIAIGPMSGYSDQQDNAFAVGFQSGYTSQGKNALAIGVEAGYTSQGNNTVAIGVEAGYSIQNNQSIAIGYRSGYSNQTGGIAIGTEAGKLNQRSNATAIGIYSGYSEQQENAFAVGFQSGYTSQGKQAIAIGVQSGYSIQDDKSIAIGHQSGYSNQTGGIAIGTEAGKINQGSNATAIGIYAGYSLQSQNAFAVGYKSGYTSQGDQTVAIGVESGYSRQGAYSVALGYRSGYSNQTRSGVAIGQESGYITQGANAVAIGTYAGYSLQGTNSIAIGKSAGYLSSGLNSISIGENANAAHSYSIVLNATGNTMRSSQSGGFFVSPVTHDQIQRQFSTIMSYTPNNEVITNDCITLTATGNIQISGNLLVTGDFATITSNNSIVNDSIVLFGNNNNFGTLDLGIVFFRGGQANVGMGYREDEKTFMLGHTLASPYSVDLVPDMANNFTMNVYGSMTVTNTAWIAKNEDVTSYIGRAAVGYAGSADFATFAHHDRNTVNDYAIGHNSSGATLINARATELIDFRLGNSTKMRMHSTGNVTVGTVITQNYNLWVAGLLGVASRMDVGRNTDAASNIGRATIGYNTSDSDVATFAHIDRNSGVNYALGQTSAGETWLNSSSGQATIFRVNDVEKMRLHSNGNVGIASINPMHPLDVVGDIRSTTRIRAGENTDSTSYIGRAAVGYNGSSDWATFAHYDRNSSANHALSQNTSGLTQVNASTGQAILLKINDAEQMRVASNGNVGIFNTTPVFPLDVIGDIRSSTRIRAGENTDTTSYLGRAAVGYNGSSDVATFAHYDHNTNTNFALSQNASGLTILNTPTGQAVEFRLNNVIKMKMHSTSNVTVGTSAVKNYNLHTEGDFNVNGEYYWNEVKVRTIPIGGIILWSGASTAIPSGFALCNGGNGTPNLQDRFIVGAGSGYAVNATGGATTVTLDANQIPSHRHAFSVNATVAGNTATAGAHTHQAAYLGGTPKVSGNRFSMWYQESQRDTTSAGNHTHSFSVTTTVAGQTNNTGNTGSHENRPPYYALCYIMAISTTV